MRRGVLAGLLALGYLSSAPAVAADCATTTSADSTIYASVECGAPTTSTPGPQADSPYSAYRWDPVCSFLGTGATSAYCTWVSQQCAEGSVLMYYQGLRGETWETLGQACIDVASGQPTITPGSVASAFARIPLPAARSIAQPGTMTLVNLETVFHAEADPFRRTLTLLGQQVELDVRPASFRWIFGDGQKMVTDVPGRPYPARDVTHRYLRKGEVQHHLEITWAARWRRPGGSWRDVPGTANSTGPTTALDVAESIPTLTGEGR